MLQQFQGFWAAFPDLRVTILRQVAEGETVVTHKVFSGTYQGGLLGIPAQPGTVDLPVMDMIVVRDGRVVEHWGVLGLAPHEGLGVSDHQRRARHEEQINRFRVA